MVKYLPLIMDDKTGVEMVLLHHLEVCHFTESYNRDLDTD